MSVETGIPKTGRLIPDIKRIRTIMKTFMAKQGEVPAQWHLIDATDKIVGRVATKVAMILMGKHRPTYTPHIDTGDFVVIVHADKARFTGRKLEQVLVRKHTGYIGSLKELPLSEMMEKNPELVMERAVRRMLPKTKLGRKMLSKLKVYRGADHPHAAQEPKPLEVC